MLANVFNTLPKFSLSAMPPQFKLTIFLLPFFMKPEAHRHEYVLMQSSILTYKATFYKCPFPKKRASSLRLGF